MIKTYSPQFMEFIEKIYGTEAVFRDLFGGQIQTLDGIANKKAFTVKTADIPVVLNEYNTDPNVAFGTGTDNSSRFGPRQEVIFTETEVDYRAPWSFNLGIDVATVNEVPTDALVATLEAQAKAVNERINHDYKTFISTNAGKTFSLNEVSEATVLKLFNDLAAYFRNKKIRGNKLAKVNSDVHSVLVDMAINTTAKNSSVRIDENEVVKFKGFSIEAIADEYFAEGEVCYAYAENIAKSFVGINLVRTLDEVPGFPGTAIEGLGKYGEYIPEANKAALVKVVLGEAVEPLTPEQELSAFEALVVNAENSVELDAQAAQAAYGEAITYKGNMSPEAKVLAGYSVLEQRLAAVWDILNPAQG